MDLIIDLPKQVIVNIEKAGYTFMEHDFLHNKKTGVILTIINLLPFNAEWQDALNAEIKSCEASLQALFGSQHGRCKPVMLLTEDGYFMEVVVTRRDHVSYVATNNDTPSTVAYSIEDSEWPSLEEFLSRELYHQ